MFVNRESELAALDRWWSGKNARVAMLWGRRRVGKTALIRHFCENRRSIFHIGTGLGQAEELVRLARHVNALSGGDTRDLLSRPYADWEDAFDHIASLAHRERLLLVLDEFPELATMAPQLPNLLRAFLDRVDQSKLRLILCGSAVRYMHDLGEERQPLYGRIDLNLQVHPFKPWEAALLLPHLAPAERAVVYGLLGGIPLYLQLWDQNMSIVDNLRILTAEPGARLLAEGELVLATEVEAGEYPRAVLHAIASGKAKHNEIEQDIRADPARTLNRLITLRLVERIQPVTETGRTRRKIYRIADNFLAFYLNLLARYRGEIDAGLGNTILPVISQSLDDHLGGPWEVAFRDHLRRLAAKGSLGKEIVAIGPFWTADSRNEIDAVALAGRSRTPVLVGEAKWKREISAPRLVFDLLRKAESMPDYSEDIRVALAARELINDAPADTLTITADDIFT